MLRLEVIFRAQSRLTNYLYLLQKLMTQFLQGSMDELDFAEELEVRGKFK